MNDIDDNQPAAGSILRFVPGFIRNDFFRKLIALIFAVLIWHKVSSEIGEEKKLQGVPVLITAKGDVEIMEYMPKSVTVTIRGYQRRLNLVSSSDISVVSEIDPLKVIPGKAYSLILDPDQIKAPFGVKVISVTPETITVHVDAKRTKDVQVKPEFRGRPRIGYDLGDIKVSPSAVTLTGPESLLRDVESVSTEPIYLDNSTVADFEVDQPLRMADQRLMVSPSSAVVGVEVFQQQGTRVFENIPARILQSGEGNALPASLATTKVSITLGGPKGSLERARASQIRAFVDVSGINAPGKFPVKVDCWVEDGSDLAVKFIIPSEIDVIMSKTPVKR